MSAPPARTGPLLLDDDELASCVQCGLCLPHCPTYRVTGDEGASPRGRITAMREVQWRQAPVSPGFLRVIDECVQCLGCETACPAGVPFGRLMRDTRRSLAAEHHYVPRRRRLAYRLLEHHRLLLALSWLLALAQRLRLVPSRRLGLPHLPLRRGRLAPTADGGGEAVWLFTGCVMDAFQRPTHRAVQRVLEAAGAEVHPTGGSAPCCGALADHAGLEDRSRPLAEQVMAAVDDDRPILVDSAGCGAMLKDYGEHWGTPEARALSARVRDVHEWLAERVDRLPPGVPTGAVAIQDPCHLRHAQRSHTAVRAVLAPYAELVELDDEGLCCGAGGAYSALQPRLARDIRERKLAAIERSGATAVASANPGCILHLAAAGVEVAHPLELVDQAIGGDRGGR